MRSFLRNREGRQESIAVPEPSSHAAMLMGAAMRGTLMYRRSKSSSYPASAFVARPVLEPLASSPHGEGVKKERRAVGDGSSRMATYEFLSAHTSLAHHHSPDPSQRRTSREEETISSLLRAARVHYNHTSVNGRRGIGLFDRLSAAASVGREAPR